MTPRDTDPLTVEWWDELVDPPTTTSRLIGLLLAALSGALVGGLLVWWMVG